MEVITKWRTIKSILLQRTGASFIEEELEKLTVAQLGDL